MICITGKNKDGTLERQSINMYSLFHKDIFDTFSKTYAFVKTKSMRETWTNYRKRRKQEKQEENKKNYKLSFILSRLFLKYFNIFNFEAEKFYWFVQNYSGQKLRFKKLKYTFSEQYREKRCWNTSGYLYESNLYRF